MGTQVVRITDEAVAIIRKYSPSDSLTRGIKEMERQLTTGNEKCTTGNSITVTASYWNTFDEHISRIEMPKMGGTLKVNELKPAERTIGKILPEERLVEPVGRQGRSV